MMELKNSIFCLLFFFFFFLRLQLHLRRTDESRGTILGWPRPVQRRTTRLQPAAAAQAAQHPRGRAILPPLLIETANFPVSFRGITSPRYASTLIDQTFPRAYFFEEQSFFPPFFLSFSPPFSSAASAPKYSRNKDISLRMKKIERV